ncbi:MAG TPA: glycoside hydrolase family 30 beta sandwich domain-containing protein [Bryobacteraceae bacterium]|nr:glycoside hydrolase family 30 beta sandwich domain-containing protein [Bryobacteraceae bacterium]
MSHQTRRDLLRLTAAGLAGAALTRAAGANPIEVRLTAGAKRLAQEPPLEWRHASPTAKGIVLDPSRTHQEVLGFGAAFTDAACWMFSQLAADARERLFHELFDPAQMGLSVCRTCMGASDYSRTVFSYDEGAPDPDLTRFSIAHDRDYILPALRLARKVNPDLFLLASPWSPPGWMKAGGSMLGGSMRKPSFPAYARYFAKFLQGYEAEGVRVDAVTSQNEVDADQDGRMPACLWGQEYEIEFVGKHLGPELHRNNIPAKIWLLDHNYNLWGRAICELDDPDVNRYADGIAWHGYAGTPEAMTRVHDAYPDKHAYWTEGGPDYTDPAYLTEWAKWAATFAGVLRNQARCIIGWNLALDEKGRPNIGPFNCGGLVTIDSATKEITRSGQYWAFAHYSRTVRRGARRFDSLGELSGISHVAFANPDGTSALILANTGPEQRVPVRLADLETAVVLPSESVVTLTWS